ncbi:hypothetical protein HG530_006402 [Fusarium avenaceum]|nr:hypothetical protein HG530_006402 [Fusarium avenaceum]
MLVTAIITAVRSVERITLFIRRRLQSGNIGYWRLGSRCCVEVQDARVLRATIVLSMTRNVKEILHFSFIHGKLPVLVIVSISVRESLEEAVDGVLTSAGANMPVLGADTSFRVRFGGSLKQFMDGKITRSNEVIARVFVVINNGKSKRVLLLVALDVEQHLLIENRVEVMTNTSSTVCLLAERRHNKRIHIEACARKVGFGRQVCNLDDLKIDDTNYVRATAGKGIWVVAPFLLQSSNSKSALALGGILLIAVVLVSFRGIAQVRIVRVARAVLGARVGARNSSRCQVGCHGGRDIAGGDARGTEKVMKLLKNLLGRR